MFKLAPVLLAAGAGLAAAAPLDLAARATFVYPHDIQGPGFQSPLAGKVVPDVRGVVTALVSTGCYIQTPDGAFDDDDRTSEGLYVYGTGACGSAAVGDLVSFNGTISEYAANKASLRLTELSKVTSVKVLSTGVATPLTLGQDRSPPTQYIGIENQFALPANTTNLETGSRASSLNVTSFGSDFWESLEGMLVTIQTPTVLGPLTVYNNTWLLPAGTPSTSVNARGGLTLAANTDPGADKWDANPEAIEVGEPLDETFVPQDVVLGDVLSTMTGIISYEFSNPVFLPLTAPTFVSRPGTEAPATNLTSSGPCSLTAAAYNIENLSVKDSARIQQIGQHIDNKLLNPDIISFIEVQDNSGSTNNGVVSANQTLAALVGAIKGATYAWATVDPVNNQDGGEPGGNIRPAFAWRTDRLKLATNAPNGNATQAVTISSVNGKAVLNLSPGRIEPANAAWKSSRKPIVAQFEQLDGGAKFFFIGAHFTSKGGSTVPYGPTQAPINGGVDQRTQQATVVRSFVANLLKAQSDAVVVLAGDFNEFSGVQPIETLTGGSPSVLTEVQVNSRVERYSYVFDQNSQQIDHIFAAGINSATVEIPHVNTWQTDKARASDHDPIVAKLGIC